MNQSYRSISANELQTILTEHEKWLTTGLGKQADLENCDLSGMNLSDANLQKANLAHANLHNVHLNRVLLAGANIRNTDFSCANLENGSLNEVDASGAIFDDAMLDGAVFYKSNFQNASFKRANLFNSDAVDTNFVHTSFEGASFQNSAIFNCNFFNAVLNNVNFGKSILSGSNMQHASLSGADLKGVDLTDVDLLEVDLRGVVGLTQEQLNKAYVYESTLLTSGLNRLALPERNKVFLSYANQDEEIVARVRNALIQSGITILDDKKDIAAGTSLPSVVNSAIDKANAIVFFISKNASKSNWSNTEISFAINNRYHGRNQRILPVVLDDETNLPFFLKDYVYINLSKTTNNDEGISKLVQALLKETTSILPAKELIDKKKSIEIERSIFNLKKMEYEQLKNYKSRQLIIVSLIATFFSITGVTVGILHFLVNVELGQYSWLIYVLLGAASSLFGLLIYMKKEEPNKNDILKRIRDIEERVREMGVRHD